MWLIFSVSAIARPAVAIMAAAMQVDFRKVFIVVSSVGGLVVVKGEAGGSQ
jgi:hypothetical protein